MPIGGQVNGHGHWSCQYWLITVSMPEESFKDVSLGAAFLCWSRSCSAIRFYA
jgi:hypothetical protein